MKTIILIFAATLLTACAAPHYVRSEGRPQVSKLLSLLIDMKKDKDLVKTY
jgi:hypothetical protein